MATPNLYVDSCCLIESLKGDLGKQDPARNSGLDMLKRLLYASRAGKINIFTSLFTVAEVIKAGDAPLDDALKRRIERLILSGRDGILVVGLTPAIVMKARDLAWNDGLTSVRGADRLHLASAISVGTKEFISWDNRLGKKLDKKSLHGLRLIDPISTTLLPDEFKIDDLFKRQPPP